MLWNIKLLTHILIIFMLTLLLILSLLFCYFHDYFHYLTQTVLCTTFVQNIMKQESSLTI